MKISLVVAVAENNVIGKRGSLMPWRLPADLAHFKRVTMGHPIIMGRTTYETIGRPLPGRLNIVITTNPDFEAEGCAIAHTLEAALQVARDTGTDEAFVIGGGVVYKQAEPLAEKIYLTKIHGRPDGDVLFQYDAADWEEQDSQSHPADDKNEFAYSFITLVRK